MIARQARTTHEIKMVRHHVRNHIGALNLTLAIIERDASDEQSRALLMMRDQLNKLNEVIDSL